MKRVLTALSDLFFKVFVSSFQFQVKIALINHSDYTFLEVCQAFILT